MYRRQEPILVYKVESSDPDKVQAALDFLRNEHLPDCSNSRLIRNEEKEKWFAFLNVYKLINKGPKVINWPPNQNSIKQADNGEVT